MYSFIYLLLFLIIPFVFWYRWRKKRFSYFIDLGIPGPKPNFLTGNIDEVLKKGFGTCHVEWMKNYGSVVGTFLGSRPILLVSDLELMKNFLVSNHTESKDRLWFMEDAGVPLDGFKKLGVGVVGGNYWKELRNIMSPTFTSRKLKQMISVLEKSVEKFLSKVEKNVKNKELIPMNKLFNELAFDITLLCIFGVESDETETYRKFHEDMKQLANVPFKDIIVSLALYYPEFSPVLMLFRKLKDKIFYYLGKPSCLGAYRHLLNILHMRRTNSRFQRNDFLQLLLNVGKNNINEIGKDDKKKRALTTEEIVMNMINLALGSYETTTSALTYGLCSLTKHPEIQDKLRKELKSLSENKAELNDYFVYGIPYLDQVINETLRYHTIVRLTVNRISSREMKWNSVTVPKNLVLQVPVYQIHHDPNYWENPERFNPDRFSPENKHKINPIVFQPFGYGPRNCIGMRFAYVTIRMTLTRLLSKYKFEVCDETEDLINGSEFLTMKPINELILRGIPV